MEKWNGGSKGKAEEHHASRSSTAASRDENLSRRARIVLSTPLRALGSSNAVGSQRLETLSDSAVSVLPASVSSAGAVDGGDAFGSGAGEGVGASVPTGTKRKGRKIK